MLVLVGQLFESRPMLILAEKNGLKKSTTPSDKWCVLKKVSTRFVRMGAIGLVVQPAAPPTRLPPF